MLQERKEMTVRQIANKIGKESAPFVLSRAVKIIIDATALSLFSKIDSNRKSAASSIAYVFAGKSILAMFIYFTPIAVRSTPNNREHKKGAFLRKACLLTLPLSTLGVIIACTSQFTLPLLQQPAEAVNITQRFLYPYAAGLPFTLLTTAAQLTVLGLKDSNTVLLLTLLNESIILILGYPLMSGRPMLKETGLGIAYFVSSLTHFFSYLLLFKLSSKYKIYDIFNFKDFFKLEDEEFKQLVKHGIPIGLYAMFELGSVMFSNMLIIQEGEDNATALFPASQISSFMSNFSFTIGLVLSMLMGEAIKDSYHGEDKEKNKRHREAKKIAKVGAGICLIAPTAMMIIFLANTNLLIQPFLGDSISESVDTLAKQFLWSVLLYEFADGLRNNFMGALWSLKKTAYPTQANAAMVTFINVPGALLTKFAFNRGSAGILPSRAVSILASAVLIVRKWFGAIVEKSPENHLPLEPLLAENLPSTPFSDENLIPEQKPTGGWFKSWCGSFSGWTRVRSDTGQTDSLSFGNQ